MTIFAHAGHEHIVQGAPSPAENPAGFVVTAAILLLLVIGGWAYYFHGQHRQQDQKNKDNA